MKDPFSNTGGYLYVIFEYLPQTPEEDLTFCLQCGDDKMTPIFMDPHACRVEQYCPNCGYERTVDTDMQNLDGYYWHLVQARKDLEMDCMEIQVMNMKDWCDSFSSALSNNHILPEDF